MRPRRASRQGGGQSAGDRGPGGEKEQRLALRGFELREEAAART